jgi:pyruvate formate lyase activating enzyme
VASLLAELRPEFPLYRTSGGGVTLTGGEPALWAGFAADLAEALRAEGIPVAMETCGLFPTSGVAGSREATTGVAADVGRLLRSLDLVLFDVKVFNEAEHRRLCGAGNARIKENLRALAATAGRDGNPVVWARLPLVPEVTAGEGNLGAWAGFLRRCGLSRLTLVPYHSLGESKRAWLGLPAGPAFRAPTEAEIVAARDVLAASGVSACAPGEEG